MDVVAVDVAPGKASTVFDGGEFMQLNARSLRAYLTRIKDRGRKALVCWDAPLTGPCNPDDGGAPGDFTQRRIESFFRDGKNGLRSPKGISVQGYAGCQHWTITRSLLGLPRTGPYDIGYDELPFDLLPNDGSRRDGRPRVVEIHPGVAAWLWCRCERGANASWAYKKEPSVLGEMWEIISCAAEGFWEGPTPENDDQFDAAVGYILGCAYEAGGSPATGNVLTLGDRCTGSFLLPDTRNGLRGRWEGWLSKRAL